MELELHLLFRSPGGGGVMCPRGGGSSPFLAPVIVFLIVITLSVLTVLYMHYSMR